MGYPIMLLESGLSMHKKTTFSFGGKKYPYEDATEDIPFEVKDKDLIAAREKNGQRDPNHCVAACAVRRQYTRAYFKRDTAVLMYPNEKGEITAKRYRFSSKLRKAVVAFDDPNDGSFPTGIYKLLAPSTTQTLAAKRARAKLKPKTSRKVRPRTVFISRGKIPATLV